MQEPITLTPIKIKYEPLPRQPKIMWPLVRVHLSNRISSLPQPLISLIDSGSNISILHPIIADLLGYTKRNLTFQEGGRSVSGTYTSAVTPDIVKVSLYGFTFQHRFTIVNNAQLDFGCILGEDSIFQWARIDFQRFKGMIELKFRKDLH